MLRRVTSCSKYPGFADRLPSNLARRPAGISRTRTPCPESDLAKRTYENAQGWTILRSMRLSRGDVNHGSGDVEVLFAVSDEALPSSHPAEGSLCVPIGNI